MVISTFVFVSRTDKERNKLNDFREEIQKHFGRPITTRRDCEDLSTRIFEQTGHLISYNTLRRFFNLAGKNGSNISQTSLNILANYCGFEHYFQFSIGVGKTNVASELFYEIQLNCQVNQKIDFQTILEMVEKHKELDQTYSFLHDLILLAFQIKDIDFIKRFFELNPIFENTHYLYSHVFFLVQTIGIQLRKEVENKEEIWSSWSKQPFARKLYFELFVDMDELIDSHYKALQKYLDHSELEQDKLFVHALLFFRAYNLNLTEEQEFHHSYLKQANLNTLHPILLGRITCYILLHELDSIDSASLKSLLEWLDKTELKSPEMDKIPFFHTWLCEGLLLLQAPGLVLEVSKRVEQNFKLNRGYVNNGLIERLLTYKALALVKTDNFKEAKVIFNQINTSCFNSYSREYDALFYKTLNYLLAPNENSKSELFEKATKLGYLRIVENLLAPAKFS
jgi:hypothetical protein